MTGEYPPYTGRELPSGGVSTAIVKATLQAAGFAKTDVLWTSWTRGYTLAKVGKAALTFPYVKNKDREKDFFFSDPIHVDRISFFVRPNDLNALSGAWHDMRICIPQGWIVSIYQSFIDQFSLSLIQTDSMGHCLKMLKAKRADIVPCADLVAVDEMKKIFGRSDVFTASHYTYLEDKTHAMISRKWIGAEDLLRDFNAGLATIRENGVYDTIMKPYQINKNE